MSEARLLVDGSEHWIGLDRNRSLLDVLRDEIGVTAAKYACGEGKCGACKVLLDGAAVPACITPVGDAVGRTVVTAAGLAAAGLHPVQEAFLEVGAMQCGYCTPGMVVAAAALLAADPHPDDAAIRAAMEENVCRCGTYSRILRAIGRAAESTARPERTAPARAEPVDTLLPRPDAPWDMSEPDDRNVFSVLPEGILVVLPPDAVPADAWSASGGAWIHLATDGTVTAFTGKVEVGQGNRTSLSQMVAEEAGVPLDRVRLVMGDTDVCPFDEGTFGSLSTPDAGTVLRLAAAAARPIIADGPPPPGTRRVVTADGAASPAAAGSWSVAGVAAPRAGGVDAVTGRKRFPSDVTRPGLLHGAVLRPPGAGATLRSVDIATAADLADVTIVTDGTFVGAVAASPSLAHRAIAAVDARWDRSPQPSERELVAWLRDHPLESRGWGGSSREEIGDVDAALAAPAMRLDATYTTAYLAHVPLEPRVAIAEWEGDRLTVWTGTQRPFGVRGELATALGLPEEDVRVIVPDTGSGFGGKHTGEAAIEAARLARAVGRPVKVAWTREEEFAAGYVRPAAVIDVAAAVDAEGMITAWDFTDVNAGSAGIAAPYDIPNVRIEHRPAASPLRQGSYRALAATANHFARESHVDDLARASGIDPVDFRLRHIDDDRLAEVLQVAADRAGWGSDPTGPGRALGIACGVEKDARVATCVEVEAHDDGAVDVIRVVTAFDCGAVVNPDNLVNQIEGATVMGLGGALFEAIHFEDGEIRNGRLSDYRVPRFSDTPDIEVVIVNRSDEPSAGAGETPIVAVAPAVANAIFAATGTRLRSMPLIPSGRAVLLE